MLFKPQVQRFISFIYIICIVRAKKLCDVRIWYLNVITDDVFNVDLTDEQRSLKNSIESLVLKSSESRETRMVDCTMLYMYNDMLKELFNYVSSGSGMSLKEVETEERSQTGPETKERSQTGPETEERSHTGPETVERSQTGHETEERSQTGPETEKRSQTDPETVKQSHTGHETEERSQTGPESEERSHSSEGSDSDIRGDANMDSSKTDMIKDTEKDVEISKDGKEDVYIQGNTVETEDLSEHYRKINEEENSDTDSETHEEMDEDTDIKEEPGDTGNLNIQEKIDENVKTVPEDKKGNKEQITEEKKNQEAVREVSSQDDENLVESHSANLEIAEKTSHGTDDIELLENTENLSTGNIDYLLIEDNIDTDGNIIDGIDETELLEDADSELADDSSEASMPQENDKEFHDNKDKDKDINKPDEEIFVTNSIPYGVCWSFGCLMSDIFDVYSREGLDDAYHSSKQNDKIDPESGTVGDVSSIKKSNRKYPLGPYCTLKCYYMLMLSNNFCIKGYSQEILNTRKESINSNDKITEDPQYQENKGAETISEQSDIVQNINVKSTTEKVYETKVHSKVDMEANAYEETDKHIEDIDDIAEHFSDEGQVHQKQESSVTSGGISDKSSSVYEQNKLSMTDFENIVERKTIQYYSKIQTLEMMIMKLENRLLTEALNKQNHSSTITKLENLILKLENELLKISRNYENLREEADNMSNRQNKYLELAYKQQAKKEYPELPDHSSKNYELISQHQAKINELADVLRNQTGIIMHLKEKHDTLEEQNRLLHQMVMNQTIFMTSIIKTVQDLSEQNIRNQNEIDNLKQKLDTTVFDKENVKETNSGMDMKEGDVIDQLDTLLFNNKNKKDHLVHEQIFETTVDENSNVEQNADSPLKEYLAKQSTDDIILNWCPKDNVSCPSRHYNSIVHSDCVPFQNIVWSTCKRCKQLKGQSNGEELEDSDYPNIPGVKDERIDKIEKDGETLNAPNVDEFELAASLSLSIYAHNEGKTDSIPGDDEKESEIVSDKKDELKEDENNVNVKSTNFDRYKVVGYDKYGKPVLEMREEYLEKNVMAEKANEELEKSNILNGETKVNNDQQQLKYETSSEKGGVEIINKQSNDNQQEQNVNHVNVDNVKKEEKELEDPDNQISITSGQEDKTNDESSTKQSKNVNIVPEKVDKRSVNGQQLPNKSEETNDPNPSQNIVSEKTADKISKRTETSDEQNSILTKQEASQNEHRIVDEREQELKSENSDKNKQVSDVKDSGIADKKKDSIIDQNKLHDTASDKEEGKDIVSDNEKSVHNVKARDKAEGKDSASDKEIPVYNDKASDKEESKESASGKEIPVNNDKASNKEEGKDIVRGKEIPVNSDKASDKEEGKDSVHDKEISVNNDKASDKEEGKDIVSDKEIPVNNDKASDKEAGKDIVSDKEIPVNNDKATDKEEGKDSASGKEIPVNNDKTSDKEEGKDIVRGKEIPANKDKSSDKEEGKDIVSGKEKSIHDKVQEPDMKKTSIVNKEKTEDKSPKEKTTKSENKPKERKVPIYLKDDKQNEPKDCYDHYSRGDRKDGLFKIKPVGGDNMVEVFCDMRRGGWTVIHRRQDGTTNFFQGWDEYKKGFGGLYGEHWLGNDNIHLLTNQDYYKLRVDLMDWDKTKKLAEFDNFLVENEDEGYRLHIGGYSGDAGDGLTKHDGSKFSTKDVDNDKVVKEFGGSCAKRFYGAGWYYKCYASNLNGRFYKGGKIPEKRFDGITWKPWTGPNYSLKKVEMKIRPASVKN